MSLNDLGCVKTLRGIIAPGILGSVVMRRAKKRKNLPSARHYDQIRFRFRTTKTRSGHTELLEGEDTLPIILHIDDGPFILGSGIQGFVEATE